MRCTFSARFTTWNQVEKRAHQVARNCRRPILHSDGKFAGAFRFALAARDGRYAVLLHHREQLCPALLANDLPDQRAEGVHVLAQGRVFGREFDVVSVHGEAAHDAMAAEKEQSDPAIGWGDCANAGLITLDGVLPENANPQTLHARVGTIPPTRCPTPPALGVEEGASPPCCSAGGWTWAGVTIRADSAGFSVRGFALSGTTSSQA